MDDRHFLQRIPWQVILLAFAVLFLLRNMMTSLAGDDYSYAFIWDGEHWGNLMDGIGERQRVEGIGDILTSQWSHYFTWGGRTPSMFFIQLFVWMGKGWFDIANTLAYVLLMLLMYWMAAGRIVSPARHKSCLLWVLVAMLLGVADYPSTMLWLTGSCVYLWTALWQYLFLLPYVLAFRSSHAPKDSSLFALRSSLFTIPLGLLAGWSEEAGSLLTVALVAVMLFVLHRRRRVETWMRLGFGALLVGCLLLMLSPGLPSATVDDVISERRAGRSKYPLHRMVNLAITGITAFSAKPMLAIVYAGIFFFVVALCIAIYAIWSLASGVAVSGWTSLILSIWLVGGFIVFSIGIAGIYIANIYNEVKSRPPYHILETL